MAERKTLEFIGLITALTALSALSIDAMLPALGIIGADLGVANPNSTQLVISAFILGMVFGELAFGPLADAFGRKPVILAGLAVFAAGAVVSMTAETLPQLVIGRIIQGMGVSGAKIGSRALVRDMFKGAEMARIMSLVFTIFVFVPMVSPALGYMILEAFDWRAIFFVFLVYAVVVTVWLAARQPETLTADRRTPLRLGALGRNAMMILRHPHIMAYTLIAGVVFGANLTYLTVMPSIVRDIYDLEDWFPAIFAMIATAIAIAGLTNARFVMRYGMRFMVTIALWVMLAGALCLLAAGPTPPLWLTLLLLYVLVLALGFVLGNINAMAMEWLGRIAGLGASVIASVSSLVAVVFAVPLGRLYDQNVTPVALGFTVAAVISLVALHLLRPREAIEV